MSALDNSDGLCGIPSIHCTFDRRLICKLPMFHGGDHDWVGKENLIYITGGISRKEVVWRAMQRQGETGRIAARAMLGMPDNCLGKPKFDDALRITDYVFHPDCPAHTPKPAV